MTRTCLAALCALLGVLLSCRGGDAATCSEQLLAALPGTNALWIDSDTEVCTKAKCRLGYAACLGAKGFPAPYPGTNPPPPKTEDMVLVFSDEFNSRWRDFSPGKDAKWQALDLLYVNGDAAVFRRDAVTIKRGAAVITATKATNKGPFSAPWGDQLAEAAYTSGMLQGWNKFCFTGGYMEARIKLPGDDIHGGLWPAVFTLGNLGRAGYLRSTDGVWPWSYDTCDGNALRQQPWTDHHGQRFNRCNGTKGRGASEIDLLEVGVWEQTAPQLSTSLQVAPVLPLGLHWLDPPGGVYFPTYADPALYSGPNGWPGINSYMGVVGNETVFRRRPGSRLADSLSATHFLNATHFSQYYVYGFDWSPNNYIRWYINDLLVYELNSLALKGATNAANQSVGDRLIPVDPQYLNINLAMSNNFVAISPDLRLPATMEIDYVRIYQSRSEINIGCDTQDFPSQAHIDANVNDYKVTLEGFEDFVGNSNVMGPTMQPVPDDNTRNTIIIAVCSAVGGVLLIGGALGFWGWRRWKRNRAEAEAAAEAGGAPGSAAAQQQQQQQQHPKLAQQLLVQQQLAAQNAHELQLSTQLQQQQQQQQGYGGKGQLVDAKPAVAYKQPQAQPLAQARLQPQQPAAQAEPPAGPSALRQWFVRLYVHCMYGAAAANTRTGTPPTAQGRRVVPSMA